QARGAAAAPGAVCDDAPGLWAAARRVDERVHARSRADRAAAGWFSPAERWRDRRRARRRLAGPRVSADALPLGRRAARAPRAGRDPVRGGREERPADPLAGAALRILGAGAPCPPPPAPRAAPPP